ncbi:Uncharacterised protein [Streptococcus pneumoniae]|nr:Uncharacterised protein [Streptococcus pneumoniae]
MSLWRKVLRAANIQQRPDAFWLVTLSLVKSNEKTGVLSTWLWRRSRAAKIPLWLAAFSIAWYFTFAS